MSACIENELNYVREILAENEAFGPQTEKLKVRHFETRILNNHTVNPQTFSFQPIDQILVEVGETCWLVRLWRGDEVVW